MGFGCRLDELHKIWLNELLGVYKQLSFFNSLLNDIQASEKWTTIFYSRVHLLTTCNPHLRRKCGVNSEDGLLVLLLSKLHYVDIIDKPNYWFTLYSEIHVHPFIYRLHVQIIELLTSLFLPNTVRTGHTFSFPCTAYDAEDAVTRI